MVKDNNFSTPLFLSVDPVSPLLYPTDPPPTTTTKVTTVRELIEELKNLPEELLDEQVYLEGCDCIGSLSGVEVNRYSSVTLTRSD